MKANYKILLATDYSEAVMNAERYAVQLAKSTQSVLSLMHVYQVPFSTPTDPIGFEQTLDQIYRAEQNRLEMHRSQLFKSLNISENEISSECIIREGSAGEQIRQEARNSNCDFIVVGTHGVSGFREVFFGSHAWDVIKKSSVPVLAIPKDALFTGIKHIVFGTEYREGELPVINFLTQLAKQFDATLTVFHVTNFVLSKKFEKEMFEKFRNDINRKVTYDKLHVRMIKSDDLLEGIENFCEKEKADLLVMSPEKQLLFERIFMPSASMTRRMSFHTHVPLLSIPDFYHPEYAAFWKEFTSPEIINEEF